MILCVVKVKHSILIIAFVSLCAAGFSQGIDMAAVNAEENFQWGVRAYHNGYYNQAVFYFEKALSLKPNNVTERIWLGRTLYKSGFENAALNEWNAILDLEKGSALLENIVQVISARRGLLAHLLPEEPLVISTVVDAAASGYYPFRRPTSVRPLDDGTLYIVAFGTNEIVHIDANGTVIDVLRGGIEGFDHPFDVLRTDDGFLFVSEYEGSRIAKCTLEGEKLKIIGEKGIGEGNLLGPQFLAMDGKGYLYVTDYGTKRAVKFDQDGNYILSIGTGKESGPELKGPTGIAINGENVYVADNILKQIFVFDESGNLITSYGRNFLKGPEGIFFTDAETLFVADTRMFAEATRIVKLDIPNEQWSEVGGIGDRAERFLHISRDPNADVFAVDHNANKVLALTPMSALSQGIFVQIERIESQNFPEVFLDVAVEDRAGNPVVGLKKENFVITESYKPVGMEKAFLYQSVREVPVAEIVLLLEKSKEAETSKNDFVKAANSIYDRLGKAGGISIVSAGLNAVLEAGREATRLVKMDSIAAGAFSSDWKFDTGVRMAATRLLGSRYKRAVIFMTQGAVSGLPYSDYTLMELLQYLNNNHIGFYILNFGNEDPHEDLRFLCEETAGKAYSFYAPDGINACVDHIISRDDPRYVLRYQSRADTRFGRRFIGVEVEVVLRKRNGRDESGYYGPIQF